MSDTTLEFGVNLNNREPLIAPDYDLQALLDLSTRRSRSPASTRSGSATACSRSRATSRSRCSRRSRSEPRGSRSARPAWSPRRATRCTSRWNGRRSTCSPAAGRSSAPCKGNPEEGVRREFEALGLDYARRGIDLGGGPARPARRSGRRARSTFHGRYFDYDDVSFYSGTEMAPLVPVQTAAADLGRLEPAAASATRRTDEMRRRMETACRRIVQYGDGWMTCCRAQHPEELTEQLGYICARPPSGTRRTSSARRLLPGDDEHRRVRGRGPDSASTTTSRKYYPELSQGDGPLQLGPGRHAGRRSPRGCASSPTRGVDHFICRFGAIDQFGQVERFAKEVLPAFTAERVR